MGADNVFGAAAAEIIIWSRSSLLAQFVVSFAFAFDRPLCDCFRELLSTSQDLALDTMGKVACQFRQVEGNKQPVPRLCAMLLMAETWRKDGGVRCCWGPASSKPSRDGPGSGRISALVYYPQ